MTGDVPTLGCRGRETWLRRLIPGIERLQGNTPMKPPRGCPLSPGRSLRLLASPGVLLALAPALTHTPAHAQEAAWTVEAHTGPVRPLAFDATEGTWMSVDVSPDGQQVVFDLLGTIYEIPVVGGEAVALTTGRSWNLAPRYSPDGERIAFSSDRSGSHQIWVLERGSGEVRAGLRLAGCQRVPALLVERQAGASTRVCRGTGYRASWSPSAPMATEKAESLIVGNGPVNGARALPGGRRFLFEHHNQATYPFGFNPYVIPTGGARIESFDEATGTSEIVVERPGGAFQPALSPDGDFLAYVHRGLEGTVLVVLNINTREERVLLDGLDRDRQDTRQAYGPYPNLDWYPDGSGVVLGFEGGLASVDLATGTVWRIPFTAPVRRDMSETIRFATAPSRGAGTDPNSSLGASHIPGHHLGGARRSVAS